MDPRLSEFGVFRRSIEALFVSTEGLGKGELGDPIG